MSEESRARNLNVDKAAEELSLAFLQAFQETADEGIAMLRKSFPKATERDLDVVYFKSQMLMAVMSLTHLLKNTSAELRVSSVAMLLRRLASEPSAEGKTTVNEKELVLLLKAVVKKLDVDTNLVRLRD